MFLRHNALCIKKKNELSSVSILLRILIKNLIYKNALIKCSDRIRTKWKFNKLKFI